MEAVSLVLDCWWTKTDGVSDNAEGLSATSHTLCVWYWTAGEVLPECLRGKGFA